jgi:hypothetical protein
VAPRAHAFPEIVLADRAASSRISRAVAAGKLRKIGPRLYSSNLDEPLEQLARRLAWEIGEESCITLKLPTSVDMLAFDDAPLTS